MRQSVRRGRPSPNRAWEGRRGRVDAQSPASNVLPSQQVPETSGLFHTHFSKGSTQSPFGKWQQILQHHTPFPS